MLPQRPYSRARCSRACRGPRTHRQVHRTDRPSDGFRREATGKCQRGYVMSGSANIQAQGRRRAMLRTAMGPAIAAALADAQVIEIMVTPDGVLRLDRLGEGRVDTGNRLEAAEAERIIRLVASTALGRAHV